MPVSVIRFVFAVLVTLLRWSFFLLFWLCRQLYRALCTALRPRSVTHGSARWASLADLVRGRALGGDTGIIVGKAFGQFIRFKRDGAVLVCAPQGQGKGVGIVIPNLLDHKGSALVTDPKGENYAVTHRHRGTLGDVWCLNAITPTLSDGFNPFSMIRVGTEHEADDAAQIADFLVIPESRDKHWDSAAKNLLTALIRYVIDTRPPEQANLATVSELITSAPEKREELLKDMAVSLLPSVAQEARLMLASLKTEAAQNIMHNAGKAMAFWSKDRIGARLTRTSDFAMMDLHREAITIYVIVPDDQIEVFAPLLRMMSGCALAALMRGKELPRPKHKPLLMLDECKAIGRLEALAKAMGLLREYCRTVLIWQDYGQLRELYGDNGEQTFMAGSGCQVTFGISELWTARQLSADVGRTTVWSRNEGMSTNTADLVRGQRQDGRSEAGRDLKDPAEMRGLLSHQCVISMRGQVPAPILASKVRYYTEWCWKGLYDEWRSSAEVVPFPDAAKGPQEPLDRDAA